MKLIKVLFCSIIMLVLFSASDAVQTFELITPNSEINEKVAGKALSESGLFRFEYAEDGIILDPTIPHEWTWVAGKGLETNSGRVDFFFWNGLLFTNNEDVEYVNYRIRTFPRLFTDNIESNAFVIGFEKEDKGILFIATDEPKDVYVKIPAELMGRELVYNYHLGKNEAKMIRITRKTKPFLP